MIQEANISIIYSSNFNYIHQWYQRQPNFIYNLLSVSRLMASWTHWQVKACIWCGRKETFIHRNIFKPQWTWQYHLSIYLVIRVSCLCLWMATSLMYVYTSVSRGRIKQGTEISSLFKILWPPSPMLCSLCGGESTSQEHLSSVYTSQPTSIISLKTWNWWAVKWAD